MKVKYDSMYGFVLWHDLHVVKDYIEFVEPPHPVYDLSPTWIVIDKIQASKYRRGYGTHLLQDYLETLPKPCGVLANPNCLDDEGLPQDILEKWYLKQGFQSIQDVGCILYRILQ